MKTSFVLPLALVAGIFIGCKNDSPGPTTDASNLIANGSFELNNRPSYVGWHFHDPADTLVSDDIPLLGGNWSLQLNLKLDSTWARCYVTGQSGQRVFELSVWAKTNNLSEPARLTCGILEPNRMLRDEVHANISAIDWTYYALQDTVNVNATDTIVVELSPGRSDFPPADARALFDLVRLQRIF